MASILDSLTKIPNTDKKYFRLLERLLSRNEFFEKIEDLGLLSLLLIAFTQIPHSMREVDIEEPFEKAELRAIAIIDGMLS